MAACMITSLTRSSAFYLHDARSPEAEPHWYHESDVYSIDVILIDWLTHVVVIADRLLGFNRGPFVVGRRVNFREEILPVAGDKIRNTVKSNGWLISVVKQSARAKQRLIKCCSLHDQQQ